MSLIRVIRRYKKKLEKKFGKQIPRAQFNITCDCKIILALKKIAQCLEVPVYVITEHALQLGLREVDAIMDDEALSERLCRHLVEGHLLCPAIKPESESISRRALRIRNTLYLLRLMESRKSPEEQQQIIQSLIGEKD
ncbi:hypothetical protein ACFLU4_01850 [Chloroflexota bacterium]